MGPAKRIRKAPAAAVSLQPLLGPGSKACCAKPTRQHASGEQPGTHAAAAASNGTDKRAGIQFMTSSKRAPNQPKLR
jgi:hypothetical protein